VGLRSCRGTLVLVVASILAGCSQDSAPAGLPLEDDFSSSACDWSTDEDKFASFSCAEDGYRILIKDSAVNPQFSRLFFATGPATLRVEASAAYAGGPEFSLYGVGCWASPEQGYVFAVSPGGGWVILRWNDAATPSHTVLAESDGEAIHGFSEEGPNRIRGECIAGVGRPTLLTVSVNGSRLGGAEDRSGLGTFPGFGFSVFSTDPGADIRFDDFAARELSDAEARAAVDWSEAERETEASSLCELDGIRYVGATAEGAEVCFTLRPDGDAWREIAFAFVAESGCPNQGMGTARMEGPTPIDAPGRINTPNFTATIDDETATGVLRDPDICGSKKFEWAASRVP
jgi:hypothetical protein